MELSWHGNKQFEVEKVQLDPLALNALYNREYFIGFAFLYIPATDRGSFYTVPEGRYVEAVLDKKINQPSSWTSARSI